MACNSPYSWKEEHINQLFDDLYEFYQRKTDESYFLGSIVVIKKDHQPQADVVDGQQRLTSLTILIVALTYYFSDCNGLTNCNKPKTVFDKLSQHGEQQNG